MTTAISLDQAKIDSIQKRIKEQIVKEYSKLVTGIDENLRAFINTIINQDFTATEFWKEDSLIYIPNSNQKPSSDKSNKKDSDVQEISPRKSPVYPSQPRRTNYPVVPTEQQRRRQRHENDQEIAERNKIIARETNTRERNTVEPPRRQNRRGAPLQITYDKGTPDIQEVGNDSRRGGEVNSNNYAKIFSNYSSGKQPTTNGRNQPISSIREELTKRSEQAKEMAPPPPPPLSGRTSGRPQRESSVAAIPREQPVPRATRDSAGIKPASRRNNSPAVNNRTNIKVQEDFDDLKEDKKMTSDLLSRSNRSDRKRTNPIIPDVFENEPSRAKRRNVEKVKEPEPATKHNEELKPSYNSNKSSQVKEPLNDVKTSVKKDVEDVKVEKAQNGFKCHQCGNKSHTAQDLAMHLEFFHKSKTSSVSNSSSPPSSFNCSQCRYDGKSKLDLERHKIQLHGNNNKEGLSVLPPIPTVKTRGAFKCERCPYSANKRMYINQHMKHAHNS